MPSPGSAFDNLPAFFEARRLQRLILGLNSLVCPVCPVCLIKPSFCSATLKVCYGNDGTYALRGWYSNHFLQMLLQQLLTGLYVDDLVS